MNDPSRMMPLVRLALALAVAIVLAVLFTVVGVALYRGVDFNSSQLVGLLASAGVLVALLANLVGTNMVASTAIQTRQIAAETQQKVNGHLESHSATTDAGVRQLVDDHLEERGVIWKPPEERTK